MFISVGVIVVILLVGIAINDAATPGVIISSAKMTRPRRRGAIRATY